MKSDKEKTSDVIDALNSVSSEHTIPVKDLVNALNKSNNTKLKQEKFDVCWDDDMVDILDWINSHFKDGNWHKNFEVTISVREFDYTEDGEKEFIDNM